MSPVLNKCGCLTRIDARELLKEHGYGRNDDSPEHAFGLEKRSNSNELKLEDVPSIQLYKVRPAFGNAPLLKQRLRSDLQKFQLDQFMVRR